MCPIALASWQISKTQLKVGLEWKWCWFKESKNGSTQNLNKGRNRAEFQILAGIPLLLSFLPTTGSTPFSSAVDGFFLKDDWHGLWQLLSFMFLSFSHQQPPLSENNKNPGKGSEWLSVSSVLPLQQEFEAEVEWHRSMVVQLGAIPRTRGCFSFQWVKSGWVGWEMLCS